MWNTWRALRDALCLLRLRRARGAFDARVARLPSMRARVRREPVVAAHFGASGREVHLKPNTCSECGRDIERHEHPWMEVRGWERQRAQGGTNHVALRENTGKLMCPECMILIQRGISPGQMELT